mmetsp:Transcript_69909/g.197238  ORF Transcript_69909/g.197238 Transcript_69909/m.197238 type:complete len:217 (+) Transcript_69909:13-663(+)
MWLLCAGAHLTQAGPSAFQNGPWLLNQCSPPPCQFSAPWAHMRSARPGRHLVAYSGGRNCPKLKSQQRTALTHLGGRPRSPTAAPTSPPTAPAVEQVSPPPASTARMAASKVEPRCKCRKACSNGISTEPTSPSSRAAGDMSEKGSSPLSEKAFFSHPATTSKATTSSFGADQLSPPAEPVPGRWLVVGLGRCVQLPGTWSPSASAEDAEGLDDIA